VIMRILRHADQAVTMEIYANASSAATREALRDLETFCTSVLLLYSQLNDSGPASEYVLTRRSAVGVTGFEPATCTVKLGRLTRHSDR
jgi:hypothetical protein